MNAKTSTSELRKLYLQRRCSTFTIRSSILSHLDNKIAGHFKMAAVEHIRLAQSLHPRLLRFFTRFPPPQLQTSIFQTSQPLPIEAEPTIEVAANTSSSDPNATTTTTLPTSPPTSTPTLQPNFTQTRGTVKTNPFLPFLNPTTNRWHSPHYSLRRQSELYKLAQTHNVLSLMPLGPKHPAIKDEKRIANALATHEKLRGGKLPISGKRAKGKVWERTLRGRMEERRKAMEGMPEMIRGWKQRGHGRGWRKWPK